MPASSSVNFLTSSHPSQPLYRQPLAPKSVRPLASRESGRGPRCVSRPLVSPVVRCPRSSTIRQLGCRPTPPAISCSSPRPRPFDRASCHRPTRPRRSLPRDREGQLLVGAPRSLLPWARRFDGPTWSTCGMTGRPSSRARGLALASALSEKSRCSRWRATESLNTRPGFG